MLNLLKKDTNIKNQIIFTSFFCNIKIFYIDNIIIIKKNIKINIIKNKIYFKSILGNLNLIFPFNLFFLIKKNKLKLIYYKTNKNKKIILNLYKRLIKIKLKGLLQKYKLILIIKGLGFKANIENNKLILKLGYSNNIIIIIPKKIKINKQQNKLIIYSIDYIYLKQFIFYLKNLKKLNVYKEKGLLLNNEKFIRKEGKKNKK